MIGFDKVFEFALKVAPQVLVAADTAKSLLKRAKKLKVDAFVLNNRSRINWSKYNDLVTERYWVCGNTLMAVPEQLVDLMYTKKNIRNCKIILSDYHDGTTSQRQLMEYDGAVPQNQALVASDVYKKLSSYFASRGANPCDHIRLYKKTMFQNITIYDKEAFLSSYDRTGIGDNNITVFCSQTDNEALFTHAVNLFSDMWESCCPCPPAAPIKPKGTSLIIHKDNAILLYLRDNKETIPFPNTWDILGGHVEPGETAAACIVREIKEELNIDIPVPQLFDVYEFEDRIEVTFCLKMDLDISQTTLYEGQKLQWFTPDEIIALDCEQLAFGFKKVLTDFIQSGPDNPPPGTAP
jgi:8-oxo-dGTP diphosphatase